MSSSESPVYVSVAPDRAGSLKVTWRWKEFCFQPYSIDGGLVRRRSDGVREALKQLVHYTMDQGVEGSGPLLKALAEAGADLRAALFLSDDAARTAEIVRWLESFSPPLRLIFQVDARVHVPWGLAYDGDPNALSGEPDETDIEFYEGFWCLKYRVSGIYARIGPKGLTPKAKRDLEIIPVLNRDVYTAAANEVPEDWVLRRVREQWGEPLFASKDFFERWSNFTGKHALIYFYCHANETRLSLGIADEIQVDTLRIRLQRPDPAGVDYPSIFILNGCATAVGDPNGGFLEAAGSPRFCGFIGTETEAPAVFAFRFGAALLYEVLTSGRRMFEVMDVLRRRHWPLSLLYSLNCYSEFRVDPEEVLFDFEHGSMADLLPTNYSRGPIGGRSV